jgi:hypothetical protein
MDKIKIDQILDLWGVIKCPINFVKAKLISTSKINATPCNP